MMIIVDKKHPKEQTTPADLWIDWKPHWTGKTQTPHDMQEKHSPTEPVDVAERQLNQSRRRIVDARLWEGMTFLQQDAAVTIAVSFEMMGRGLGYAASNWQRIPGCRGASNVAETHARLMNFYIEWAQKCAKRKLSHAMVVDVLCFGFTCRMIHIDRRLRNGSTRENLMKSLSLYCELRGWKC